MAGGRRGCVLLSCSPSSPRGLPCRRSSAARLSPRGVPQPRSALQQARGPRGAATFPVAENNSGIVQFA